MNHKQKEININSNKFMVDIELVKTIELLNKNNWLTSGCCIGDYNNIDTAWVIIQEIDENNIVKLMQNLNNCGYQISKRMYYKNSKDTLYYDYLLETPKSEYKERCNFIYEINKNLEKINEKQKYNCKTMMNV